MNTVFSISDCRIFIISKCRKKQLAKMYTINFRSLLVSRSPVSSATGSSEKASQWHDMTWHDNKTVFCSFVSSIRAITCNHTDKKENQVFLTFREIQSGAVAKSYMTNSLLIYGEIFAHFLIYQESLPHIWLCMLHSEFPYIWGKFDFLFYQCSVDDVSDKYRCRSDSGKGDSWNKKSCDNVPLVIVEA